MATASSLISPRVAVGFAEERLSDLAERIARKRAHHCVVLDRAVPRFLGLLRLSEFAGHTSAAGRILADLVTAVTPLTVRATETAAEVARLLRQHDVDEAVVLDANSHFVGLITHESVLAWIQNGEGSRPAEACVAPTTPENTPPSSATSESPSPRSALISQASANASFRLSVAPERTLLLVEDHRASREALDAFLSRRGYRVLQAGNAVEAREAARTHAIDLVISDIGLPDGDGMALMQELRREHGLNGIAISAYGSPADVLKSRAAGFVLHLAKPLMPRTLEEVLEHYFAMTHASALAARGG